MGETWKAQLLGGRLAVVVISDCSYRLDLLAAFSPNLIIYIMTFPGSISLSRIKLLPRARVVRIRCIKKTLPNCISVYSFMCVASENLCTRMGGLN